MKKFDFGTETNRLILRPFENGDYEAWLTGFENRRPSQHRHDEGKMDMNDCTEGWFHAIVDNHQKIAKEDQAYVFGVFRKEDGAHLGAVDFSTIERENFQWARFGYSIHNQYWRKGYGKEAVAAALKLAFNKLHYHRIEAHINLDNTASIRLVESVGMEYECVRKGFIDEFGGWTDNLVYFKNAEELSNGL
ncbi:GNAT family N-acetyltransferase [Bacillus shivajii]|uniref:GNAT family N-acetyltransferase n=1 Tax=Bacillus shivajii TaxID=1983719 RepID=UPI001CFBE033|nr:GNAT family N-acetyltransferase [Bacillus shivajii]UCZ53487.1 GNAT family N-acetyltransferase [Bacillus shivajii]